MLLRQHLRRSHESALIAVFRHLRDGQRRHGRFPAAHIALHEALHGNEPFHVIFDIGKRLLLIRGERERQILHRRRHERARRRALDAGHAGFPFFRSRNIPACMKKSSSKARRFLAAFCAFQSRGK